MSDPEVSQEQQDRPPVAAPPPAQEIAQPTASSFRMVGSPAPIFKALAAARQNFLPIVKGEEAEVRAKDNPGKVLYTYGYASLDMLIKATEGALSEQGLVVFHALSGRPGAWVLRTWLSHETGSYFECLAQSRDSGGIQALGSELTYLRRYTYMCLLGIFPADEDDEGAKADAVPVARPQDRPTAQQQGPRGNTRPTPPAPPKKETPAPKPETKPVQPETKPATPPPLPPPEEPERPRSTPPPLPPQAAPTAPAVSPELTEATMAGIKGLLRELGYKKDTAIAKAMEVVGKSYTEFNEKEGAAFLSVLESDKAVGKRAPEPTAA